MNWAQYPYLPVGVTVLGCAAARWAVCRVSPFSPTFTLERQQSLEVQSVRARQSAKVKALGNRNMQEKSCTEMPLLAKLKGNFW